MNVIFHGELNFAHLVEMFRNSCQVYLTGRNRVYLFCSSQVTPSRKKKRPVAARPGDPASWSASYGRRPWGPWRGMRAEAQTPVIRQVIFDIKTIDP